MTSSWMRLLLVAAAVLGITTHGLMERSPATPVEMVDSGSWYSRESWPHDGRPYETEHFVVHSDAASRGARMSVARVCEQILADLIDEFELVPEDMFCFPGEQEKIDVYAYKEHYPHQWGARAYYAGLIIWSLDHSERSGERDYYKRIAKHELMHVVEALLKGRDVAGLSLSIRVHMWFSEGLAEAVCGGTAGPDVRDLLTIHQLTEEFGHISPVAYRTDADVGNYSDPETIRRYVEYVYPMSRLAIEYLMDPEGHGKSPHDLISIFTDIADGSAFTEAFERRMGMSVEHYRDHFFTYMHDYLSTTAQVERTRSSPFLWILAAVGTALAAVLLAVDALGMP